MNDKISFTSRVLPEAAESHLRLHEITKKLKPFGDAARYMAIKAQSKPLEQGQLKSGFDESWDTNKVDVLGRWVDLAFDVEQMIRIINLQSVSEFHHCK